MNAEQQPIDYALLASYLAGEATAEQQQEVEAWRDADPANAEELEKLGRLWWEAGTAAVEATVDVDAAWQKVQARTIGEPMAKVIPLWRKPAVWSVAASLLLLLMAWWAWPETANEVLVAQNQAVNTTLDDGSAVSLNVGSKLEITEMNEGLRQVKLEGEAYFEVASDQARPFVIDAGPMEVKVLGTSFEVEAFPASDSLFVAVVSGRVQVDAYGQQVVLSAGQRAQLSRTTEKLLQSNTTDTNTLFWKTGTLVFSRTELAQVVKVLNKCYKVDIQLANPTLKTCSVTSTFSHKTIDEVLEVLTALFDLEVAQQQNQYILTGDGC
ncbi:MAG: FecR domain-containing protein [Salibacteraceae bacterium]